MEPKDSELFLKFLNENMPSNTSYLDAVDACRNIYCTTSGLPSHVAKLKLDKETIAAAFAAWTERHKDERFGYLEASAFDASFHRVSDKGHWLQVIASIFKGDSPKEISRPTFFPPERS